MKYIIPFFFLSACSTIDSNLQDHLKEERDFTNHQYHVQQSFEKSYDPEYVDDCYYYEELICEFE